MTDHDQHDDELARRLRASVDHRIPEEARQQHLAAIGQALSETAPTSTVAGSGRFTRLRRGLTAVAASFSLLVPTGVAVAAQRAMPGEPLYDVKQATEVVRQVVDGSVRARNRLDELERLLDAGAPREELQVAVERALDAVQTLPADHPLQLRLLRLLNRYDRLVATADGRDDDRDDDVRAPTSGSSRDDRDDDREDRSGSGSGDDDPDDDADDDGAGSGSGSDEPTETESDDSSGPGSDDDPSESETDDDSSGPGSGEDPSESETDDDSRSGSGDDDEADSDDDEADGDDDSGSGSD